MAQVVLGVVLPDEVQATNRLRDDAIPIIVGLLIMGVMLLLLLLDFCLLDDDDDDLVT